MENLDKIKQINVVRDKDITNFGNKCNNELKDGWIMFEFYRERVMIGTGVELVHYASFYKEKKRSY